MYICAQKNLREIAENYVSVIVCLKKQSYMMITKNKKKGIRHDTTMCGDPIVWYPMRVTYSRGMKVKGEQG